MRETTKRVLGQEHIHTLSSMANLAFNGFEVGEAINGSGLRKKIINTWAHSSCSVLLYSM
jgi:hypothetical protein